MSNAPEMAKRDLSGLRIRRDVPAAAGPSAARTWTVAALLLAAIGGGAAYMYVERPRWIAAAAPGLPAEPARAQAQAVTPAAEPAAGALSASGYIVARRKADVAGKATGRVAEVLVEAGDRVEANQVLARLEQRDVEARVNEARALLERAQLKLSRASRLFQDHLAPPDEVEAAEADEKVARAHLALAEADLADTEIRAPFSGVVIRRSIDPGAAFSPVNAGAQATSGGGMFTIVDLDSLEAEVEVAERQVGRLRAGGAALVEVDALPGKRLRATFSRLIPTADRTRGVVKVKLDLVDKDPLLLPDMTARATFLER
jgi:RND family efflux transporter MFP subunit